MSPNPFQAVEEFEKALCDLTGAPYAAAVDSCTAALFLSMQWLKQGFEKQGEPLPEVEIPHRTFVSVPIAAIHSGYPIRIVPKMWHEWYRLDPLPLIDSAISIGRNAWFRWRSFSAPEVEHLFVCVSFQFRKQIPIGRGGAILHNCEAAQEWLTRARFYGRDPVPISESAGPHFLGWRHYMLPEEASRGLCFLQRFEEDDRGPPISIEYPDLRQMEIFKKHVKGKTDGK